MGDNQKQGEDTPRGSPSSPAKSLLPPKTPAPPSPYLAAARAESSREGRDGEGEADSFSFSQLAKARGEPAAPLPAKPGQRTDPAAGGEQQPAGSSGDGFNSSGLAHLALRVCTAWLALLGSLSPR